MGSKGCSLRSFPESLTWHGPLTWQNLVTWPSVAAKEGWEMWFFKEKHTGLSKNHTAQGSVIKTKYRINTGQQLEVSMH